MFKKIITIILIVIFIISLIVINSLLNKESEKMLYQSSEQINIKNEEEENKMEILKVTSENFESEVLQSDKTVLIDFYADWCGPCKMLSPIVDEVAEENTDIKVVKINVDNAQDLAMKYQVMSIPTLVVIKDGREINRSVGLIDKAEVVSLIK